MNKTLKIRIGATLLLATALCTGLPASAQTKDETLAAAERTFKEAAVLEESKAETLPLALQKYQAAQNLYQRVGEKRGEANAFRGVARIYLRLRERDNAIAAYQKALGLFEEIARKMGIAIVLSELGNIYLLDFPSDDPKELELALGYYVRAQKVAHEINDKDSKRTEADALFNTGSVYFKLRNKEKTVEFFRRALAAYEELGDQEAQAATLHRIGVAFDVSIETEDKRQAHENFRKAAALYLLKGKKTEAAYAMNGMGSTSIALGNRDEGISLYKETLIAYREGGAEKFYTALTLENLGLAYSLGRDEKDVQQALDTYLEAAAIFRESNDKPKEAELLAKAGDLSYRLRNKEQTVKYYKQAQAIYQELAVDNVLLKPLVARGFIFIGATYEYLGNEQEAVQARENYRKAQAIYQELYEFFLKKDDKASKTNRVDALRDMADAIFRLKDRAGAIETYKKAVAACKEISDELCEATMLTAIAGAYYSSDKAEDERQSVDYYRQAKQLFHKVGDINGEIWCLRGIARAQKSLNAGQASLQTYSELLLAADSLEPIRRDILKAEANIGMGHAYQILDDNKASLEKLEAALSISGKLENKAPEIDSLGSLIQAHFILGDAGKILDRTQRLLSILTPHYYDYKVKKGYAHLMRGYAYDTLGDKAQSIKEMQVGLQSLQEVNENYVADLTKIVKGNSYLLDGKETEEKSQFEEVERGLAKLQNDGAKLFALYYLTVSLSRAGDYPKAVGYAQQGLSLSRKTNNRTIEALNLVVLGFIKWEEDENHEAVGLFQQAIAIFHELKAQQFEAYTLMGLTVAWKDAHNPRLAIFYGKQAVRILQEMRRNNKGIDSELQKGYVAKVNEIYKTLTELLIAQGRLDEAQQVINLARDQEAFDSGSNQNQIHVEIQFTPREQENDLAWKAELARLGKALREFDRTKLSDAASSNSESVRQQLEAVYEKSYGQHLSALKQIAEDFKQSPGEKDKVPDVSDIAKMQTMLHALGSATKQKPAVLYTFIGDDKFYILLNTPDDKVQAFESPINESDLNKKLLQFYALLQSQVYDPRRLGKELYDTIIPKGLEAKLQNENVETLIWSLDGSLRYIPMAALSPDGIHYLVERYNNVVFTRADTERMTRKVSSDWTGYGFFTSEPRTVKVYEQIIKFSSLDKDEAQIFRTRAYPQGIIGGNIFPEADFTKASLINIAKQKRPLIHISSHFIFYPGNSDLSFLLLGNGDIMPMSEMKGHPDIFQGVELLTLSACDTAAQFPNADGKEIDGFAELAQRLGAGSVMASLWAVSDISTTQLMKGFYRNRQVEKLNKAAALRKSQLDLLYGRNEVPPTSKIFHADSSTKGRQTRDEMFVDPKYRVKFRVEGKPYAHPYYWSPFVMYGNPQ